MGSRSRQCRTGPPGGQNRTSACWTQPAVTPSLSTTATGRSWRMSPVSLAMAPASSDTPWTISPMGRTRAAGALVNGFSRRTTPSRQITPGAPTLLWVNASAGVAMAPRAPTHANAISKGTTASWHVRALSYGFPPGRARTLATAPWARTPSLLQLGRREGARNTRSRKGLARIDSADAGGEERAGVVAPPLVQRRCGPARVRARAQMAIASACPNATRACRAPRRTAPLRPRRSSPPASRPL